jgi:hypothetical protein
MSRQYQNPNDDFFSDDVKVYDYPIQGKMVVAQCQISEHKLVTDEIKDQIRNNLIHQIADFILQNKLVEFTQMKDPMSFDTHVKARCFITPDSNVRILRSLHKVE